MRVNCLTPEHGRITQIRTLTQAAQSVVEPDELVGYPKGAQDYFSLETLKARLKHRPIAWGAEMDWW